jgi:hypothetical protein
MLSTPWQAAAAAVVQLDPYASSFGHAAAVLDGLVAIGTAWLPLVSKQHNPAGHRVGTSTWDFS